MRFKGAIGHEQATMQRAGRPPTETVTNQFTNMPPVMPPPRADPEHVSSILDDTVAKWASLTLTYAEPCPAEALLSVASSQ
eukprot:15440910-Alexandrium_andersonii.AAC.1